MNKSRFIWGIICLALAVLLAVLNVTLDADKLMFTVGDKNMPELPPIILSVVGIVLLVSAVIPQQLAAAAASPVVANTEKAALNRQLEAVAWGLFLIMLGGFAMVPQEVAPKGLWSIGVGIIMLGLNATRYFFKVKMSGFTTFLGLASIIGGVLQLIGLHQLEGAFFFIILGAFLIVKPWLEKRQVFGKAEES